MPVTPKFKEMKTLDEFIKHYGIDYDCGYTKDFSNPVVKDLVDDLIRVIKSYEEDSGGYDLEGYRVEKLKCVFNAIQELDN